MKTSKPKNYEAKNKADWTAESTYKGRIPQLRVESAKTVNTKTKPVEEIHVPVRTIISTVKSTDLDSHGTYVKNRSSRNSPLIPKVGYKREEVHKHHLYDCDQKTIQTVTQMKLHWQKNITTYEKLKKELNDKQTQFMKTYSTLRSVRAKLQQHGHSVELPQGGDALLCPRPPRHRPPARGDTACGEVKEFNLDVQNFLNLPTQLLNTCEMALEKRSHIIQWLDSLTEDKGIRQKNFAKQINEFKLEGEYLQTTLEGCKSLYYKEFNEITEFLRNSIAETNTLQSQTKHLETQLTELSYENELLCKQIGNIDEIKSMNSNQIEELEEELRSEKSRLATMSASLTKAQERAADAAEHSTQLELALDNSHTNNRMLEEQMRNMQQQTATMRDEFESEKSCLEESLRQKQSDLDELTKQQESLHVTNEKLEMRLEELTKSLNESRVNNENNSHKLAKLEEKYTTEVEHKKELENKIELLLASLADRDLECKEMKDQLNSKEYSMCKELNDKLGQATEELTKSEMEVHHLNKTINTLKAKYHELMAEKTFVMEELKIKEDKLVDLERKHTDLQHKLFDSEKKMGSYESQITSLRDHVDQLKQEFGQIQNLSELNELVSQQRTNLEELRKQNEEMNEKLQKQDLEIQSHKNAINEQDLMILKKEEIIKNLKLNDEVHSSAIELLTRKLEKKPHMDSELVGQLGKKEAEIQTLLKRLNIEEQKIEQLEKIILSFEEGPKKERPFMVPSPNKLEYMSPDAASRADVTIPENLDALIRILENELECPNSSTVVHKDNDVDKPLKKFSTPQRPSTDMGTRFFADDKRKILYTCHAPKKTYLPKFSLQGRGHPHARHSLEEERPFVLEGVMHDGANINPRKVSYVSAQRDEKRPKIRVIVGNSR